MAGRTMASLSRASRPDCPTVPFLFISLSPQIQHAQPAAESAGPWYARWSAAHRRTTRPRQAHAAASTWADRCQAKRKRQLARLRSWAAARVAAAVGAIRDDRARAHVPRAVGCLVDLARIPM